MKLRLSAAAMAAIAFSTAQAHAQDAAPPASAAPPVSAAPSASSSPAQTSAPATPAPDAASQPGTIVIGDPPAGKGQIVFFRSSMVGMILACTVHEGDATVSRLANGKYFVHVFDPGVHTFVVASEAKDVLRMEVEAGETYYVKCSINMGLIAGRPNLSPSDKDTFDRKAKGGLKLEKPS